MGIGKTVVKQQVQKTTNNALDEMGAVGDVIDKHTTTGPLDKADDAIDKTADNLKDKKKDKKKDGKR
jgi:hypothetical protein